MVIRMVGTFYDKDNDFYLVGIRAFTQRGIRRKVRKLVKHGFCLDGILPLCRVEKFPKECQRFV